MPFTLSLVDRDGTVRYQSAAIQHLLGYRPGDVAGAAWFSLLHADDAGAVRAQFSDMIEQPEADARWIIRFRAAEGGWRPIEVRAKNLLQDPDVASVLLSLRPMPEPR